MRYASNPIRAVRGAGAANERRRAFTLVEVLIVLIILGILATIVIPQFTSASQQAKENILRDDLRFMRMQIGVFKAQHRDVPPGHPGGDTSAAATNADFLDQMTFFTDTNCGTSTTGSSVYKFGPYLSKMPQNPLNGLDTILIVNGAATPIPPPDESTGWIYKPDTQDFIANSIGNDLNGVSYVQY